MQISKIIDFTSLIKEKSNSYSFNPSIAHWKGNLYLCCYRNFVRYNDLNSSKYNIDPLFDPNHPWLGGDKSSTFWNYNYGSDGTSFFIMNYEDLKISNVKSLIDRNSISELSHDNKLIKTNYTKLNGKDSRLLHLFDNYFILSYNKFINDNLELKKITCEKGCFVIGARIVKINEYGNLTLYKENIVCPSISNKIEKNWSFWGFNKNVFFSYGLSPKHNIYNTEINFDSGNIECVDIPIIEKIGYYGYLEKFYNKNFKNEDFLYISLTTPSIPRLDNPSRYIGVGHVKYKNDYNMINKVKGSPLEIFYNETKNYKRHPIYDYLMFIYEFNPNTAEITKVTDMFLPEKTEYTLAFPSGIEYTHFGDLMISYGDHDSLSKLLVIKKDMLQKLLKPIKILENNIIDYPLPKDIKFILFPEFIKND